jgi:hypothetical protein
MPHTISWFDEAKTVLLVLTEGKSTWEQYHAKYDDALQIVKTVDYRVDVIMDSRGGLPPGNPIPHLRAIIAEWDTAQNLGVVVVLGRYRMHGFVQTAANIAGRLVGVITPGQLFFVNSLDDAMPIIEADRVAKQGMSTHQARQLQR